MINRRTVLLLAICAVVAVGAFAQQSSITPESLRVWLTYLSSDQLEGRATFSEGLGLAGAYIAEQLKEAGVKPGGGQGTYFQRVEVLGIRSTNHSTVTVEVNGQQRTFKDGEGVTFPRNVGGKRTLTLNEVEFAGYGLDLDANYNDYKDLDVKGKLVVWIGARGPQGTDQRQARRLLGGRTSFAIEGMGAAATIAPAPDGGGQRRGGAPNGPDFTTVQRFDSPVPPGITASDDFLEFLFSGSDVKYTDLKAKAEQQEDLPKFSLKDVSVT